METDKSLLDSITLHHYLVTRRLVQAYLRSRVPGQENVDRWLISSSNAINSVCDVREDVILIVISLYKCSLKHIALDLFFLTIGLDYYVILFFITFSYILINY